MNLVCVDPRDVQRVWAFVSGMIHTAIRRGDISAFKPVEQAVYNGDMLLWLAIDDKTIKAAAVSEISLTENHKICTLVACGGKDMDDWLPLLEGIEHYARIEQCNSMRIIGRIGWERKLPQYRPHRIVLERKL